MRVEQLHFNDTQAKKMRLYTKILIVISLTLASLILILYIMSRTILLESFVQLEKDYARQNIERVLSAFYDELDNLTITTQDYAEWDDTYAFVVDGNQDYIDSNLGDITLIDLNLNLMLFMNTSGQIVFSKTLDPLNNQQIDVPANLSKILFANDAFLNHADTTIDLSGLVLLPEGPMLIAARSILTNESKGPSHGVLVFGRYLNTNEVEHLGQKTHLPMTTYLFDSAPLPADLQVAKLLLSKQTPSLIESLDNKTIAGYALIEDINGQPALILKIELPRNIYWQGLSSISYFLISLLVIALVFTVIMLWFLRRLVFTRLFQLSTNVNKIGTSSNFSGRVAVSGNDELTDLSKAINQMLGILQQARDELERRVEERTLEFSEANTQLKLEIAERTRMEKAIIQARDRALEASRLKTELLANVSHELRTPLNVILGYTEMLKMDIYGPLTDQQQQPIQEIINSTEYLTEMITALLSEAQLDSGRLELSYSSFAPAELLDNVRSNVTSLAQSKGLTLTTTLTEDLPANLWGDPNRLQQILFNLVSNAIKFTKQGKVEVQLYRPDTNHWALQVSDTGPGIPVEARNYIFEPFRQVDGSLTREYGGVGLGLSIVKQLTELMDGHILLTSEVGCGTTFNVVLPIVTEPA